MTTRFEECKNCNQLYREMTKDGWFCIHKGDENLPCVHCLSRSNWTKFNNSYDKWDLERLDWVEGAPPNGEEFYDKEIVFEWKSPLSGNSLYHRSIGGYGIKRHTWSHEKTKRAQRWAFLPLPHDRSITK